MPSRSDSLSSKRVNDSLNAVGSFWSENLHNRDQAYYLVDACSKATLFNQFENGMKQLLNRQDFMVYNVVMSYDPDTIFFSGDTEEGSVGANIDSQLIDKLSEGSSYTWSVPLSPVQVTSGLDPNLRQEVIPIRIATKTGELVLNSDFIILNGFLQFYQDPGVLFEDNNIIIAVGKTDSPSIYRFPLGVDHMRNADAFVKFARVAQSPENFKLALAEFAGLKVLESQQKLLAVTHNKSSVIYTFEKQVITIDYEHDELQVNKVYPRNLIIGEAISIYYPNRKRKKWWREIDFRGGIALGPLTGHKGLLLPDDVVMAYIADSEEDSENGSKAHVRVDLIGDADAQDAYWEQVADTETRLGQYLNKIIKIGEKGDEDPNFDDKNFEGIFSRLLEETEAANIINRNRGWPNESRNVKRLGDPELISSTNPNATPGIKYVNALDVFFEAILAAKALVITIDATKLPNVENIVRFINEQRPGGCATIILIVGGSHKDEINLNDTVTDTAVAFEIFENENSEVISLSNLIAEQAVGTVIPAAGEGSGILEEESKVLGGALPPPSYEYSAGLFDAQSTSTGRLRASSETMVFGSSEATAETASRETIGLTAESESFGHSGGSLGGSGGSGGGGGGGGSGVGGGGPGGEGTGLSGDSESSGEMATSEGSDMSGSSESEGEYENNANTISGGSESSGEARGSGGGSGSGGTTIFGGESESSGEAKSGGAGGVGLDGESEASGTTRSGGAGGGGLSGESESSGETEAAYEVSGESESSGEVEDHENDMSGDSESSGGAGDRNDVSGESESSGEYGEPE